MPRRLTTLPLALAALLALAAPGFTQAPAATPPPTEPHDEPAVNAVARALPAVVNINTERVVRRAYRDPYDDFIAQFFGGPMRPPRTLHHKVQSLGSGFIIDASGYIVTNEHVVERAEDLKIQVTTPDGKSYEARYITGDPEADLALLKIESKEPLPFIPLADVSPNRLGQTVLVVGNPLGYGHSVARGILSATNRSFTVQEMEFTNLLQTDAAINPGNSGGPLIDLGGRLIGVASAKMAYTPQGVPTQGIGFAIPATVVAEKVAAFKRSAEGGGPKVAADGPAAQRKLGLTLQDLTPELVEALGVSAGSGVLISDVEPGGPAARAGLRRGTVLYQVGPFEVNRARDVDALLEKASPRASIDLAVGVVRQVGRRLVEQQQTVTLRSR